MKFYQMLAVFIKLTMTRIFRSFHGHFHCFGQVPLLFAKQKLRLPAVAQSSTTKFKNFGNHRSVTNTVFKEVGCGENVHYK